MSSEETSDCCLGCLLLQIFDRVQGLSCGSFIVQITISRSLTCVEALQQRGTKAGEKPIHAGFRIWKENFKGKISARFRLLGISTQPTFSESCLKENYRIK